MKKLKLSTKLNILSELQTTKATELAVKYDVSRAAISKIKKHKQLKVLSTVNSAIDLNRHRLSTHNLFHDIENEIYDFVNKCNTKGFPISRRCIQHKARQLAVQKGIIGFKASDSWFKAIKKRLKLTYNKATGKSKSVDMNTVDEWLNSDLPSILDKFKDYEIWNCDETGLQYKAIRQWGYFTSDADKAGIDLSKLKFTILFTVSLTGEKKRPLIIGPSARPHSFSEILHDTNQLGIDYYSNKKSWMTGKIFSDWLSKWDSELNGTGRKVLLLCDNAGSHKDDNLNLIHIKLIKLPKNTTSKLQPLDAGIIANFKENYYRNLNEFLISLLNVDETVENLLKSVSLLQATRWTVDAWNQVHRETIIKCFNKCL